MRHTLLLIVAFGTCVLLAQGSPADRLTTEEDLRWQVLRLREAVERAEARANACQGELGQWRADRASDVLTAEEAALKAKIEAAHGQSWDPKTGAFSPRPLAADPEGVPE